MNKIIVSGNPQYGVAKAISKEMKASFFSRTHNNSDLCTEKDQIDFATKSLEFNIYISCSALYDSNQEKLIKRVYERWKKNENFGMIIILGSSIDIHSDLSRQYAKEKESLRKFSRSNATSLYSDKNGIRVTYVAPGFLNTAQMNDKNPNSPKIDLSYLVNVIKWIIDQPKELNICELTLDAYKK